MKAAFGSVDITPPVGAHKIGWIMDLVIESVMDPLYAHLALFENEGRRIALIQLDTLSVRWSTVSHIRRQIEQAYGVPGSHIMIAATHNHCGPAMGHCGDVPRDDAYIAGACDKIVTAFGDTLKRLEPADVGFAHVYEFGLSHNRRTALRDGTTITHGGGFQHPNALYIEGPIDPEVGVLAARRPDKSLLGVVANFTCHPTHHGGGTAVTAGFPGVLAGELRKLGCPASVYLNGASGNVSPGNPYLALNPTMEAIGARLAQDAVQAIEKMTFHPDWPLSAASTTAPLPYRSVTDEEVAGTIRGAQRFVDPSAYDRGMPKLLQRIRERGTQPAEVQVLNIGNVSFAGIPAEYFVEHGLRIKEGGFPRHVLVVGEANGMVGYVPTQQAFRRGGYETTFCTGSRLAPEAGDMLADAAIALIRQQA